MVDGVQAPAYTRIYERYGSLSNAPRASKTVLFPQEDNMAILVI
ncbi:uncharacterized protein METZ01_LOCUS426954, partial [marine metagenome]